MGLGTWCVYQLPWWLGIIHNINLGSIKEYLNIINKSNLLKQANRNSKVLTILRFPLGSWDSTIWNLDKEIITHVYKVDNSNWVIRDVEYFGHEQQAIEVGVQSIITIIWRNRVQDRAIILHSKQRCQYHR